MRLDTDELFEAFQFWWFALAHAARPLNASPDRLDSEERLRAKLSVVSRSSDLGDGGRVPVSEKSELDLADEERLILAELVLATGWTEKARTPAISSLALLGLGAVADEALRPRVSPPSA